MGRIDCRTPGRRRAECAMWCGLYALIIGCGALLGYLGFGSPERLFAEDGERRAPIPRPAEAREPNPATDTVTATPAPDDAPGHAASFFGIPVE